MLPFEAVLRQKKRDFHFVVITVAERLLGLQRIVFNYKTQHTCHRFLFRN